jgi:hypothetical protein
MKSTSKKTAKESTPRKAVRKVSDETGKTVKTAARHGSASAEIEAIEDAAGEVGTIASRHFFNIDEMPRFIREACADATARASACLNLPNPDETTDDLVAFQQMIDLFKATGDEFTMTATPAGTRFTTNAGAAKKTARRSPDETNAQIAEKHGDLGQNALNFYYTVNHLPAAVSEAINDAVADLAYQNKLLAPSDTGGEVEGFKRLVKLLKATATQDESDEAQGLRW